MPAENSPIALPKPITKGDVSLEEAIALRRSVRNFPPCPITKKQLSQLLWSAQGITDGQFRRRAVASAGAIYPLEIFVACGKNSAKGLEAGVYHYDVFKHTLTLIKEGDMRPDMAVVASQQRFIHQAPLDIIICADYERTLSRYGERGYRYVHMEAGHASQNIYLEAAATGLATVAIGAFEDDKISEVLELKKETQPLYIMPVGKAA